MDFIFGTLATDELQLVHHRAQHRGIQHVFERHPRDPLPGEPITLTVYTGSDLSVDRVACYYTLDGSEPAGSFGVAHHGQVMVFERKESAWDTLTWGYRTCWQGTMPGQHESAIVRYRIGAWSSQHVETQPEAFADWPEVKTTTEQAAQAFFRGEKVPSDFAPGDPTRGKTFTFHVDRLVTPDWAREAVIYQIFVDRFYPGDGKNWLQTENLRTFCGGTLWGVLDKLDYIGDLGVTAIWLSPICVSPTHHGYDATDYFHVEPRLGGDEALHALVEAAHERGIHIILDLVCNHVSNQHPYFQAALREPHSPCRDWFTFDDSPIGYRTFFGVRTMPEINLEHPDARHWMLDIACYWLREFDVDGYRLDYANGPGPGFWADFRAACRSVKAHSFCFGEVIETPDLLQAYVGALDGCLDFHIAQALRKTYAWGTWTEAEFDHFAAGHYDYFSSDFVQPTFLDNHDMDRFLFAAKGERSKLCRALARQMQLPQPPIIYYGTEVGLSQTSSTRDGWGLDMSRAPMPWGDDQDKALLDDYKAAIRERRGLVIPTS